MRTVWKAVIEPDSVRGGVHEVRVPARRGARPVHVGAQGDDVCVWFEVDPDEPPEDLVLSCVGTGFGRVPEEAAHVGTVQHGGFVWHVYWYA